MRGQLEKMAASLEDMLRTRLCGEILEYLGMHRQPQGSRAIAAALGKPHHAVQRAVCELIIRDRLARVGLGRDDKPAYRPVEVGPCEWCGLISHRLVAGECPACQPLTQNLTRPSLARQVC
jgi:hypothetical protein